MSEKRVGTFTSHKTKLSGIQLSAQQINDHINFINNSNNINKNLHLQEGDRGFSFNDTLLPRLNAEIKKSDYQLDDLEDRYKRLNDILAESRESGKELLLQKYPGLRLRIEAMKN